MFARVRDRYAEVGLTLLPPLGFENTFAILVRGEDARRYGLQTIDDAVPFASTWRAGFGYEFLQRADGYPGLAAHYGLRFATPPRAMDLSLIYRALAEHQVDLIAGDATSGLIAAYDLVMLQRRPSLLSRPTTRSPVARRSTLLRYPEVRAALERLAGRISIDDMRRINYAVDAERRDPGVVVRDFLARLERERPPKG